MSKVVAENQQKGEMKTPQRKLVERMVIAIAVVGTVVVVSIFGNIGQHISEIMNPKSSVYGTWVEQNVATYAAEKIVLSKHGVTVKGRVVATQFEFDGTELSYQFGNHTLRYKMKDHNNAEMKRISSPHYQPVYRLSGKDQNRY